MYFSHLMLCDHREGISSQERYEQQLAEVRLLDELVPLQALILG